MFTNRGCKIRTRNIAVDFILNLRQVCAEIKQYALLSFKSTVTSLVPCNTRISYVRYFRPFIILQRKFCAVENVVFKCSTFYNFQHNIPHKRILISLRDFDLYISTAMCVVNGSVCNIAKLYAVEFNTFTRRRNYVRTITCST